jgi:hypothetical protein
MSVKVTTQQQTEQKEKPFPKIMISKSTGNIILFEKNKAGTCIVSKELNIQIGSYSDTWTMSNFTDYNEPITLQND